MAATHPSWMHVESRSTRLQYRIIMPFVLPVSSTMTRWIARAVAHNAPQRSCTCIMQHRNPGVQLEYVWMRVDPVLAGAEGDDHWERDLGFWVSIASGVRDHLSVPLLLADLTTRFAAPIGNLSQAKVLYLLLRWLWPYCATVAMGLDILPTVHIDVFPAHLRISPCFLVWESSRPHELPRGFLQPRQLENPASRKCRLSDQSQAVLRLGPQTQRTNHHPALTLESDLIAPTSYLSYSSSNISTWRGPPFRIPRFLIAPSMDYGPNSAPCSASLYEWRAGTLPTGTTCTCPW